MTTWTNATKTANTEIIAHRLLIGSGFNLLVATGYELLIGGSATATSIWSNSTKNSTSFTNTTKNSTSYTNQTKN